MALPRVYKTEAIVIRHTRLGEADKVVTLYTPGLGKVRAVAKGVRRPGSKLSGHVDLLTHSQLMLAHGRNLDIVTQAQEIDAFIPLKNDLARLSLGFYIAELVDSFTEERLENEPVFGSLLEALQRVSESRDPELAVRYFELHLVDSLGYRPQLHVCPSCNKPLQPVVNHFHPPSGGVLCPVCSSEKMFVRPLSLNAFKVMRLWQDCDYTTAARVRIDRELGQEIELVLRSYIRFLLEREVKATDWLDRLKRDQALPLASPPRPEALSTKL